MVPALSTASVPRACLRPLLFTSTNKNEFSHNIVNMGWFLAAAGLHRSVDLRAGRRNVYDGDEFDVYSSNFEGFDAAKVTVGKRFGKLPVGLRPSLLVLALPAGCECRGVEC